jgi:Xaa-Pro aminopeptidase
VDPIYPDRLVKLRELLSKKQLDGLIISIQENRQYLSGFTAEDTQFDESAGALIITDADLVLATDSRFTLQAHQECPIFEIYQYEKGLVKELPEILSPLNVKRIGFESKRISFFQYREIIKELDEKRVVVELIPADDLVEELRQVKDQSEISKIQKALDLAEAAFEKVCQTIKPGMTEKQIAWAIEVQVRKAGGDGLSFPTIVASGPNSALPHAVPGKRKIKKGEPILFDWGVRLNGYCSDISRTLFMGKPDDTFLKIHQTVRSALEKAVDVIKPGISGKTVDATARSHIDGQGFKGKFSHGLGHGTGLAVHEGPRLSPLSTSILEPGMIVTVEPGIYIADWGGVRIENLVVVREHGAEVLNRLDTSFCIGCDGIKQ